MSEWWLNEYRVEGLLGRGGMGVVLRARHTRTRAPVAIKLLTSRTSSSSEFVDAFHREIHAVAQLDHPNIAAILDTGVVETASPDFIVPVEPGAPFYAMELVENGTLTDHAAQLDWRSLQTLLIAVLGGLAHAHARGVIHRDLKPANILIARDGDTLVPKLTDFGLAELMISREEPERAPRLTSERRVLGTPRYMAPEQILGRWREQGAWTDLYALGCIAYRQLSGRLPFDGEPATILRAHLEAQVPPIEQSICPLPVQQWLRTLLEKDPLRRFRHAADAAHALAALADADVVMPHRDIDSVATDAETWVRAETTMTPLSAPGAMVSQATSRARAVAALAAGDPDWRTDEARPGVAAATLYHLRPPRFVFREAARDRLWDVLGEVRRDGAPRCCVIRGLAGTGKSRLADWFARRGGELGVVQPWSGMNQPDDPWAGIREAILAVTRVGGLSSERAHAHIEAWYGARREQDASASYDCALLRDIAIHRAPRDVDDALEAVARFFALAAEERPVLLWLDDVHLSSPAMRLANHLLELRAPIIVVCTSQRESLAQNPRAARQLGALEAREQTTTLVLEPLDREEQRELVRRMLDLEAPLADQIAERSSGNPLFAVQLVGHCIDRGILLPGPHGYRLADDNEVVLPDHVRGAWGSRVDDCLATLSHDPDEGWRALELAATLGHHVELVEWYEAATAAGVALRRELIGACVARGLLLPSGRGWAFAHALFRGALQERARATGRAPSHHRACAEALRRLGDTRRAPPLRIARHFVAARAWDEALEFLLQAGNVAMFETDLGALEEVIELLMRFARAGDARARDAATLGSAYEAFLVLLTRGSDLAHARGARAFEAMAEVTSPGVKATLYSARTLVELHAGDPQLCRELAREAVDYVRECGRTDLLPESQRLLAVCLLYTGHVHAAYRAARDLVEQIDRDGEAAFRFKSRLCLAQAALQVGEFEHAMRVATEALDIARSLTSRSHTVDALRLRASCHRALGQYADARACWRETCDIHDGSPSLIYSWWEVELALIAAAQGDDEEAERWLEAFFREERNVHIGDYVAAALELARIHAARGSWGRWDELVATCDPFVSTGRAHRDAATAADRAAAAAEAAGDPDRAALVRAIAAEQWSRLRDRHQGAGLGSSRG